MSLVTICLTVCVIQTAKTDKKTVQTVTLPVTNKVIVIDAGHGVPDEGAESSNGISEAKTNLNIALKLQTLLEDDDFIIDEENIIERLGKELASLIKEVAEYNEGI